MLKLSELAQFLTNKLNEIAQSEAEKYDFLIHAEVGKNEPGKIGGILRTNEPTITPVNGIENIMYNGSVKFAVPAPQSNFNLINIENIIGKFIEAYNGLEVEFSNGKGLLTFTLARAEDYKIEYKTGEMLPLLFSVMVNYTENMITSATKVWQIKPLDDENAEFLTIPYLSESVLLEKSGKTNNISDALYQQTLLLSQIKFYRFEIPYETNDTLCSMLQKDILNGDFGKKYELRYYDGVSFLNEEGKDFRTTVSIYRTGDSGSRKPNTSIFNITFSDVDGGQNAIKYYMALVDNPFDSLSENTQYFESQAEQKTYFQTLINEGADYDEIPAPNLNSLYLTSQVYLNTRKYDIFNLINKNYAIIKATNDAGTFERFFFYVINNGDIGANGQVNYNLTMDTVQTFLINDELEIQGSFINKAHLNRWIEVDENTVQFNGNYDSDLFEREELKEVAKRLVARKKLKYYSSVNPQIADWLNKHIAAWCYVIANTTGFNIVNMNESGNPTENYDFKTTFSTLSTYSTVDYGYHLFCFPIYKADLSTTPANYGTMMVYPVDIVDNFDSFMENNPVIFNKIFGLKLSVKPPFDLNTPFLDYNITESGKLILGGEIQSDGTAVITTSIGGAISKTNYGVVATKSTGDASYDGIFNVNVDNPFETNFTLDLNLPEIEFDKEEITGVDGIGVNRDKKFNPKLNASDYKTLTIGFGGSTFDIDLQKLNREEIIFRYTEMITADTTKGLLRFGFAENLNQNKKPVFNSDYAKSFNGFSYTNDFSLPYSTDAYASYMANNKNAYLSFQSQQNYNREMQSLTNERTIVQGAVSATTQAASFNFSGAASTVANTALDVLYSEASFRKSQDQRQTQFNLSMDNMKNAPDSLANANGNAIFMAAVAEFGIYAEIYEGLDVEMEMANDIMFRDGYNYNRFGEVKDFINIRRYFNYVKATLGNISGVPISEEARRNLKQRFATGIRFWNKNDNNEYVIDYTKENYERWLSPSQV